MTSKISKRALAMLESRHDPQQCAEDPDRRAECKIAPYLLKGALYLKSGIFFLCFWGERLRILSTNALKKS